MAYYNWEEIMSRKNSKELKKVISDRFLGMEAAKFAKQELNCREDSLFQTDEFEKKYHRLERKYPEWNILKSIAYKGDCNSCKNDTVYLKCVEKGPWEEAKIGRYSLKYKTSNSYINLFGTTFLLNFNNFSFKKIKESLVVVCIECGQMFLKCPECNTFQILRKIGQNCTNCNAKIAKPDNSEH